MSVDEYSVGTFFAGHAESRRIFDAVATAISSLGPVQCRVTKSQIAFRRRIGFAWVWMPVQYLGRGAPLVLSVALRRRDGSARWKEIVETAPGRFMHHLELRAAGEVDAQVLAWLAEAWEAAR